MPRDAVDERYALLGLLGSGGMAEVYRAYDRVLQREVAIKVLKESWASDEEFVERFREEACSAAALSHPNVVHVYDFGAFGDGTRYAAMELVRGGTLKERLQKGGALGPVRAVEVALQVARALRAAHERGIVHCDVKPQNVLLTEEGVAKVADFGIARAVSSHSTAILGTTGYMAPEQAAGGSVGPRSDLYSLGVILSEMLAGEPPSPGELRSPASKGFTPGPSGKLAGLVSRLLAEDPRERYPDSTAAIEALLDLAEDLERDPEDPPPRPVVSRSRRSGKTPAGYAPAAETVRLGRPGGRGLGGRLVGGKFVLLAPLLVAALALFAAVGWKVGEGSGVPEAVLADRAQASPASEGGASGALEGSPAEAFVHRATPESISGNSTYLDHPRANDDPGAVLSVTQNWNPDAGSGVYNDHPIGVWYDGSAGRWAIFNQDRAEMTPDASFNVLVWTDEA